MTNSLCEHVKQEHNWTPEQKNSMRRLFEHVLRVQPNLVQCLRETQGNLVLGAEQSGNYDWPGLAAFDMEMVKLTDEGKLDIATNRISDRLALEIKRFWPDCPLPSYQQLLTDISARPTGS